MRNKKHFNTMVCFIVGVVILTTAAFANYGNASGYTTYKNALKNMLFMDNYTANMKLEMYDGDVLLADMEAMTKIDSDGQVVSYSKSSQQTYLYGYSSREYSSESWEVKNEDPTSSSKYLSYYKNSNDTWNINSSYSAGGNMLGIENTEENAKIIRFAELAADMLVGDLKNSFVYTGSENGNASYQVVLTGSQLPEIVNAGISVVYGQVVESENYGRVVYADDYASTQNDYYTNARAVLNENGGNGVVVILGDGSNVYFNTMKEYYQSSYYDYDPTDYNDFFQTLAGEPVIDRAECYLTVDKDGNLVSNTLYGSVKLTNVFGETKMFSCKITVDMSDIGTTVIPMPEIPANATVYDYSKGSDKNGYSYTITKNGITVENSKDSDAMVENREWFMSITPEERVEFVCGIMDFEYDPDDFMTRLNLIVASGEYDEYYRFSVGLDEDEFLEVIAADIATLTTIPTDGPAA